MNRVIQLLPYRHVEDVFDSLSDRFAQAGGSFKRHGKQIRLWQLRARQRRQLAQLSDLALKDIGFSRYDAMTEASKPFWKP